jgi:copper resistance protein D
MIQTVLHSLITLVELMALSTLMGVALCLLWAKSEGHEEASQAFAERLRRLFMLCLFALVISSVSNFLQRTMEMSGLGIMEIPSVLTTVLFKTHYGKIGLVRAAGVGLALVIWFIPWRGLNSRFGAVLMLCASVAIAFSRSATSHASDFGDLTLQELSDWLHLLSTSAWAGALIVIAIVFPPSAVAGDDRQQRIVAGIADRFYVYFGPVLSILVLTGLYNAWVEVGSFGALVTTTYGRVLFAKLVLFILLTFIYIAPPQHGQDAAAFAGKFLYRTRIEAIVILIVLLCAAMLTHSVPARHSLHKMMDHEQNMDPGHDMTPSHYMEHGHGV